MLAKFTAYFSGIFKISCFLKSGISSTAAKNEVKENPLKKQTKKFEGEDQVLSLKR